MSSNRFDDDRIAISIERIVDDACRQQQQQSPTPSAIVQQLRRHLDTNQPLSVIVSSRLLLALDRLRDAWAERLAQSASPNDDIVTLQSSLAEARERLETIQTSIQAALAKSEGKRQQLRRLRHRVHRVTRQVKSSQHAVVQQQPPYGASKVAAPARRSDANDKTRLLLLLAGWAIFKDWLEHTELKVCTLHQVSHPVVRQFPERGSSVLLYYTNG